MDSVTDQSLIEQSIAGNDRAFEQLVYRYQERLVHSLEHATGSREDALEIAQQAFVRAWQKLSTFRAEAQFYSWLYRIARNIAVSRLRQNRIQTSSLDSLTDASGMEPVADPDDAPTAPMEKAERISAVRAALQQIPEEFRQALVLKEIDGFSYEEISQVMDITMGTVRSRIFRARHELSERLKRMLDDE